MNEYHLFTEVLNPRRGMVEVFLCSIYASTLAEARRLGRKEIAKGDKLIVRAK